MNRTEWARDFFKNDRFATKTTGIEIEEAGEHYARCSLKITSDHLNAANTLMGGALFTLGDFAFAVASNSSDCHAVSVSSSISYISAAKDGLIIAEAKCIKHGKSICFYNVDIIDDEGKLIALISITGAIILKLK